MVKDVERELVISSQQSQWERALTFELDWPFNRASKVVGSAMYKLALQFHEDILS
jgi:hypothetical protein